MNPESLYQLSHHPQAPIRERLNARQELELAMAPTRSQLPAKSDVDRLAERFLALYEEQAMTKAWVQPQSTGLSQSNGGLPTSSGKSVERKAIYVDETGHFRGSYRLRPSAFGAEALRAVVANTPCINAIILRRIRTVSRFLRTCERGRDVRFVIRQCDAPDTGYYKQNDKEKALEQLVLHSGWERDPIKKRRLGREDLMTFMGKTIRDILTLDAWTIELTEKRFGRQLDGYYAVDAATVFLASEEGYNGDDQIEYVQIVNGMPEAAFSAREMSYLVMNPRSDVRACGYGYAPPEMIIKIITGYLNAITYNLRGFDTNSIPKGMLTVFGNFSADELTFFKQQWNALVRGVNNKWALPVMASENKESGAHFEKFDVEFNEMHFAKWMTFLTSVVCSIYGCDPAEIYTEGFHAGRSSLSGSDMAERLADARDTGLEPLMNFLESGMTDHILGRIDPDFVFRFEGLHPYDQKWEQEVDKMTSTVNELREKEGREKAKGTWGDAPLNPVLQQAWMAEQQAAMGGQPGKPGEEPAPNVTDSGDRKPVNKEKPPQATESGDRENETAPAAPMNQPEQAARDRLEEPSTMVRKALEAEILLVG